MVRLCEALGISVTVADPFDLRETAKVLRKLMAEKAGVRVLVLRRACELVRMKKQKKQTI